MLYTLRQLVDSGRTVVVTIHQPRSKVFHMFDKILFLSEGKVAFFGSPLKVFEFINNSLRQQVTVCVCVCVCGMCVCVCKVCVDGVEGVEKIKSIIEMR